MLDTVCKSLLLARGNKPDSTSPAEQGMCDRVSVVCMGGKPLCAVPSTMQRDELFKVREVGAQGTETALIPSLKTALVRMIVAMWYLRRAQQ